MIHDPKIRERLATFLLLLGSDQDGEVIAAARAAGRLLKSFDLDWHDVANRVTGVGPALSARRTAPSQKRTSTAPKNAANLRDNRSRAREMLHNDRPWLTPQQREWLEKLAVEDPSKRRHYVDMEHLAAIDHFVLKGKAKGRVWA
jgi:hypothetical protein